MLFNQNQNHHTNSGYNIELSKVTYASCAYFLVLFACRKPYTHTYLYHNGLLEDYQLWISEVLLYYPVSNLAASAWVLLFPHGYPKCFRSPYPTFFMTFSPYQQPHMIPKQALSICSEWPTPQIRKVEPAETQPEKLQTIHGSRETLISESPHKISAYDSLCTVKYLHQVSPLRLYWPRHRSILRGVAWCWVTSSQCAAGKASFERWSTRQCWRVLVLKFGFI